jgi:hypothetical protein
MKRTRITNCLHEAESFLRNRYFLNGSKKNGLSYNPQDHCRIHSSLPLDPIPSQLHPVHTRPISLWPSKYYPPILTSYFQEPSSLQISRLQSCMYISPPTRTTRSALLRVSDYIIQDYCMCMHNRWQQCDTNSQYVHSFSRRGGEGKWYYVRLSAQLVG